MRYGIVRSIALAAVLLAVAMTLAMVLSDRITESPDFCVSCHLPSDKSGKPLHQKKMKMMTSANPFLSLAGVHFKNAKSKLGCPECHHGRNLHERVEILWFQIKNTFIYFMGHYEEPRSLASPISDEFCSSCHGGLKAKAVRFGYHSFMSHDGLKEITCVKCHAMHTPQVKGGGFLDKNRVLASCALCHKNPAQSEPLRKALGL